MTKDMNYERLWSNLQGHIERLTQENKDNDTPESRLKLVLLDNIQTIMDTLERVEMLRRKFEIKGKL